ncbi:glycosyltransferase family 4 protein [Streptomyces sp. NPDC051219]|uniref:glycosyltransferase family 4 protein n=1 Tax=Streptomyces sp. NPDC051219 TaxID=3155283 RepID=UPI00342DBCEF
MESHLGDYAGLLARAGYTVTVLTGEARPQPIDQVHILSHPLLRLSEHRRAAQAGERDGRGLSQAEHQQTGELHRWLREVVEDRAVRLLHGHNLHHFSPVPALALNRLREQTGTALFHTYHSIWPDDPWTAQFCRSWDRHYVVSDYLARACREHLGIRARRTYLGIPTHRFQQLGHPPPGDEFRVLLPARLIPDKGAELAVEMLARLRASGLRVRLVLTNPPEVVDWHGEQQGFLDQLDELVDARGLRSHVDLVKAAREEMAQLYAGADVVVYPSNYPEPLGLAPLEAMSAGRPVVVTGIGGLPEAVRDGETGYVVPAGDLDGLSDRVRRLLLDPELSRRMGVQGRAHVDSRFNLRTYAQAMDQAYATFLEGPARIPAPQRLNQRSLRRPA